MVVYRAMNNGTVWIRPQQVFHEVLEVKGRRVARFAPLVDAPENVDETVAAGDRGE